MLLKLLKKYDIGSYYFVSYEHETKGYISTLALAEDPLNYIDIYNKEEMPCFGLEYKMELKICPNTRNITKITPLKAIKLANEYFEQYKKKVLENKNSNEPHPYGVNK